MLKFLRIKSKYKSAYLEKEEIFSIKPYGKCRGNILFSYIIKPFVLGTAEETHSNIWESKEIVNIFLELGYTVDIINWDNKKVTPSKEYDVIFDIHSNLSRLADKNGNAVKIFYITGSYPRYQNETEQKRINYLKEKGKILKPKRALSDIYEFEKSLEIADKCLLIGNKYTLQTFPERYQRKMDLINVTSAKLRYRKSSKDYIPQKKRFLWFFPNGAVHRSLDILLEIFSANNDIYLDVVGSIDNEKDFFNAYRKELTELPNIKYYGYQRTDSRSFKKIMKEVFCFIAPSCSEGMSSSVATCLTIGLYPIISRSTGITLPNDTGIYIDSNSPTDIKRAIYKAYNLEYEDLAKQIDICQRFALNQFSGDRFIKNMTQFISKALNKK